MTKAELVDKIAEGASVSKAVAGKAIEITIGAVKEALQAGGKVTLVGFGTFSVADRKARVGRNPRNGKEIKIPARKVAKFSPGAGLKEAISVKAKPAKAAKPATKAKKK
jgi:DNA-binding protein HU-beta